MKNQQYKLLVLTSDPENGDYLEQVARQHFERVQLIFWEFGNAATKPAAMEVLEQADYNLLISQIGGLILKPGHLQKAEFGCGRAGLVPGPGHGAPGPPGTGLAEPPAGHPPAAIFRRRLTERSRISHGQRRR